MGDHRRWQNPNRSDRSLPRQSGSCGIRNRSDLSLVQRLCSDLCFLLCFYLSVTVFFGRIKFSMIGLDEWILVYCTLLIKKTSADLLTLQIDKGSILIHQFFLRISTRDSPAATYFSKLTWRPVTSANCRHSEGLRSRPP